MKCWNDIEMDERNKEQDYYLYFFSYELYSILLKYLKILQPKIRIDL